MENAHLRTAIVQYSSSGKNNSTSVRVFCDRFAKGPDGAFMLSVFGNDSEIGAITAAISVGARLEAILPDGQSLGLLLGDKPTTFRGTLTIPGRARPVRHLLAFAQVVAHNGADGILFALLDDTAFLWTAVTSFMGLPALPEWASKAVAMLRARGAIAPLSGFNCSPVLVSIKREDLLAWMGEKVAAKALPFPDSNRAILWPAYSTKDLLFPYQQGALL